MNGCDHGMKLVTGFWEFFRGVAEGDFSEMRSRRRRGNSHKLQQGKFQSVA